ncbi:MAG TPA: glycoside hydrolase family 3 protein, partial [Catenuloplanes sp.]
TAGGAALDRPVALGYTVAATGTATAGRDYAPLAGTLTFPAGTASGSTTQLPVDVLADRAPETAETVPIQLGSPDTAVSVAQQPVVVINAHGLPYLNDRLPARWRAADLLRRMTLTEKIGQMTQAERGAVSANPRLIAEWELGSILSGGGSAPSTNTPAGWAAMVNGFQEQALTTRLQIPLIYGVDAVHGHGNVYGATIFPHNIGLGATRDPALVERIGHATAAEVRATGIPWNFAPCVCVARDERWGRTYESFSEDPALVVRMETAIDGLQGRRPGQLDDPDRVLATAKHYAGDGDTEYNPANPGAPIDQGVTVTNRRDFERIDLAPYLPAVRRHRVGSVMPSFSSVDFTEDGVGNPTKMHAHRDLITGTLKGRMGFDGFVITDWEGIHQIPDPAAPTETGLTAHKVRVGVNAGSDMFMEPYAARQFEELLLAEVNAGRVSRSRIDDAVSRILVKKFELGLFERPFAPTGTLDVVGSPAHRQLARQAAAQSQVLLKNAGNALPLRRDARVYVAGRNADNIGNQAGGWTMQWQGVTGADVIPGSTVLDGIREVAPGAQVTYSVDASAPTAGADVGVVVVGETPYAEGFGDVGGPVWPWGAPEQREPKSLSLSSGDRAVIDKVCAAIATCVVLVVSGRPQVIGEQLAGVDALVASWLPGSEGTGVADVLFGARPFTGRLSMSWPAAEAQVPINVGDADYSPLFPYGWGLRTDAARERLRSALNAAGAGDRAAVRELRRAVTAPYWNGDGSVRDRAAVLRSLSAAARALGRPSGQSAVLAEAVVSVARDLAQAAVVAGSAAPGWAALVADADHALAAGDPARAVWLLTRV